MLPYIDRMWRVRVVELHRLLLAVRDVPGRLILWLDLRILLRTIPAVLSQTGRLSIRAFMACPTAIQRLSTCASGARRTNEAR